MAQKLQRTAEYNLQSFGQAGFKVCAASFTVTGDFVAITFLEDSTAGNTGIVTTTGDDLASGTTMPAGATIYGDFTSIKLSAGKAIAYIRA